MLKAIVVDDEDLTREILVNNIPWEELGISVAGEADDGLHALQLALEQRPDIILCDIRMPRMNGIEFAEQLQNQLPNCKYVFLSGYSDKEYLKSAIRLKAVSYIEKPVNLEEISEALRCAASECLEERKRNLAMLPALHSKLCLDLTESKLDMDRVKNDLSSLQIDFPENATYVSAIFWLYSGHPAEITDRYRVNQEICNRILELMQVRMPQILVSMKGEDHIVLHARLDSSFTRETFTDKARDLLMLYDGNRPAAGTKVFIGIGNECRGVRSIFQSYQNALIALKRCFFNDSSCINLYEQDDSAPLIFDDAQLTALSENIRQEKKDEVILFIKRLANVIRRNKNTHQEAVKNFFVRIILLLTRFAEDRNIPLIKNEYKFILDSITGACTIGEIEKKLISLIESIFYHIEASDCCNDVISRVTVHIHKNFQDESLSVNGIAESLHLSTNYLCALFKKETGKTINQYLTEVRIQKAKEYLKDSDIKLYNIAKLVGYSDGQYFSKVFTKTAGMNPREYRERHSHEK